MRITHPFHPLYGGEFEYVEIRVGWREERVYILVRDGSTVGIPAQWTSIIEPDPFVVASNGRSHFRPNDLLELSRLLVKLEGDKDE
ncbi:MAG: DUF5372 family protein [Armatimonadota bacterium]